MKYIRSIAIFCSLLGIVNLSSTVAYAEPSERVVIKYLDGTKANVKATLQKLKHQVHREFPGKAVIVASVPLAALDGLRKNLNIEYIEPDVKRYQLAAEATPYGIKLIQSDLVDDAQAGNTSVCVIDSGVELSHPDLNTNMLAGSNDLGTGLWYQDSNGHGTHVLGTIAATTNEFGVVGVMPGNNINLHIVKVFDASGWAYSSSLVAALEVCIENGADVVNMSLGGSSKSRFESRAFEEAYSNGVMSIAASGNNGSADYL